MLLLHTAAAAATSLLVAPLQSPDNTPRLPMSRLSGR